MLNADADSGGDGRIALLGTSVAIASPVKEGGVSVLLSWWEPRQEEFDRSKLEIDM